MPTDMNRRMSRPEGDGDIGRRVMIYGSTGYTGRLIARRALETGLEPILAGRRVERVRRQAESQGLLWRAIRLDSPSQIARELRDVRVVIHAAGPFTQTARPMLEACLLAGAHYLDIGGELPAFLEARRRNEDAVRRGVMIMPGAGWAVTASDCLAAHVARLAPEAKSLRIGIARSPLLSRGTARSALGLASSDVVIRRNGRLVSVPVGRLEKAFDYGEGARWSMALSWPDVLTGYHTTGVPNIEVYVDTGTLTRILAPVGARLGEALRLPIFQPLQRLSAEILPEEPSDEARMAARHVVVAEAEDVWRRCTCARLETIDGYSFTALSATEIARRVLGGDFEVGFQTPARVYGADFVLGMEGSRREDLYAGEAVRDPVGRVWASPAPGSAAARGF